MAASANSGVANIIILDIEVLNPQGIYIVDVIGSRPLTGESGFHVWKTYAGDQDRPLSFKSNHASLGQNGTTSPTLITDGFWDSVLSSGLSWAASDPAVCHFNFAGWGYLPQGRSLFAIMHGDLHYAALVPGEEPASYSDENLSVRTLAVGYHPAMPEQHQSTPLMPPGGQYSTGNIQGSIEYQTTAPWPAGAIPWAHRNHVASGQVESAYPNDFASGYWFPSVSGNELGLDLEFVFSPLATTQQWAPTYGMLVTFDPRPCRVPADIALGGGFAPGQYLRVRTTDVAAAVIAGDGNPVVSIPIPNDPAILGTVFYYQALMEWQPVQGAPRERRLGDMGSITVVPRFE